VPNYLVLALESALAVFGIRSVYEQPRYEVVERIGPVEVRRYAPRLAAETTVAPASEDEGRNEAFRILAGYIFGGNHEKADIAMTSPVAAGAGRDIAMTAPVETRAGGRAQEMEMTAPDAAAGTADGVTMRFFLPGKITRDNAPVPNDPRVRIVAVPEETIAALTFSGRGTKAALDAKTRELRGALAGSSWRAAEEPYALFYDPPFTIPFLRRNEVAVRVTRG
jgi:hypothetical protein